MLERLARFVIRRRRGVLVAAVVFLLAAGALAGGVSSRLSAGGFDRHDSEAAKAGGILAEEFRSGTPNLVLLVTDPRGADHPAVIESGTALTRTLATENGIITADSYWTLGRPESLRSRAGDHALVLARIAGDEDAVATRLQDLRPRYQGTVNGLEVRLGGQAAVNEELVSQTEQDLVRAEVIIFPITLVALVFVFGSVVAASLPLAVGAFAMIGAMLVLWILAAFTDVSVFALNVIIGLGLGLAIDYSLFVVSRFREELRHGRDVDEAIVTTVRTAGRTVLFAAVTIACAMSGLLVFPIYFLRSFGYAAIATTLVAALGAIIVLPALLRVIGRRVDRLRLIRPRERPRIAGGFWRRIALAVMRRPLPVATTVILVLLVLGSPFLGLRLSLADERVLPDSAPSAQVGHILRTVFPTRDSQALQVVASGTVRQGSRAADISAYAQRLSGLPSVVRVEAVTGTFSNGTRVAPPTPLSGRFATSASTYLTVVPAVDPYSKGGERLVRDVRGVAAPFPVAVGGPAANFLDSMGALRDSLPVALTIVAATTFVLLFLMTGSLVLPFTGIVLSLLSLTAALGAMVWIFQDGHLRRLVGDFTVTGAITYSVPVMLFSVAFGLSMDYGVFLLSRIREEYDRLGDNVAAVATGLERSGRVITAAAGLIALVFLAFVPSGVTYMKVIGLGLALAVIMDATLIRGALVPAFIRLAGRANWWAPRPLRPLYERFALRESPVKPPVSQQISGEQRWKLTR